MMGITGVTMRVMGLSVYLSSIPDPPSRVTPKGSKYVITVYFSQNLYHNYQYVPNSQVSNHWAQGPLEKGLSVFGLEL